MGDSAYGSAVMLGWLVHEHGIEPHVTVFDRSARTDGTFSRDDFTYDHERGVYACLGGRMLTMKGTLVNDGATVLYRVSKHDCEACPLKPTAAQRSRPARCRVRSTRGRVIWPVRSQNLGKAERLADYVRRSRCCSRTSSAFSSWIGSDYEDRTVLAMSSCSQQPPRTSGNWPS